jgi:hypothetical protein
MSLFGGIISGAMIGGGNAMQVNARDQALAERQAARDARIAEQQKEMEALREAALSARAERLEELRVQNAIRLREHEVSPEMTAAAVGRAQAIKQGEFDITNKPENVETSLNTLRATKGVEREFKTHELSPGQEVYDNQGRRIAGNDRKTTADVYSEAYGTGAKGNNGAGRKLDPEYAAMVKDIDAEQKELQKGILGLEEKLATNDPAVDKAALQKILTQRQQQVAQLETKKHGAAIKAGMVDPDRLAKAAVAGIQTTEDVNTILRQARQAGGVEWMQEMEGALGRAGAFHKLQGKADSAGEARIDRAEGGIISSEQKPEPVKGAAPEPRSNVPTDLFERETKEIDEGLRTDYSTAASSQMTERRKAVKAQADQDLLKGEQQRQLEQSREIGAISGRQQRNQQRAEEVKAITVEAATRMSPQEAEATLNKVPGGTELPKKIREILLGKVR